MKIEIRLRQVLQRFGIREHGAQARLAKYLEVDRQVVGRMVKNEGKHLSLENIEGLCRWLLDEVDPTHYNDLRMELPGCLFSMAGLWERMFRSERVTTYLGEKVLALRKRKNRMAAPARTWVSSMDVTAALKITQRLASEESSAQHRTELVSFHLEEDRAALKTAVYEEKLAADRTRARELYEGVRKAKRETSLVVGSQKVNILCEFMTSGYYGAEPFKPPPPRNPLPFYVSYRQTDPPIPQSCFGGHERPRGLRGAHHPGIYYRVKDGEWALAPWELKRSTAGLILVNHSTVQDSLDVVLFGFCAQGTRHLGDIFCENPDQFWPKQKRKTGSDRFGAFVVPIQMVGDERPMGSEIIALAG